MDSAVEAANNITAIGGVWTWVAIAVTCVLFGWWILRAGKGNSGRPQKPDTIKVPRSHDDIIAISAAIKQEKERIAQANDITEEMLGSGEYKCLCFREINGLSVVDFTTIPQPIGEMYNIDPSCPLSGSGYIVKVEDGKVVDYDPRKVEYKLEESPEYADLAINIGEISKQFWAIKVPWWKSPSTIIAVVMIAVTFILGLVVLGA